jgi:3-deoxy-D-manno-octulosonic-acid transferase
VGEVLGVSRLVGELDRVFPAHRLVISTTTRTGQELARERFGPNRVFYCPLDLPWAVHAYLKALQPRILILAETEFWPNLLNGCFRRGIPVAVVNARISDRSWPRYQMLCRLWKPIMVRLSSVLGQSQTDADRLRAIGCLPERVSVAGNLKFDIRASSEADATRRLRDAAHGLRFVVAGSTLEGEESALLEAWPRLLQADPQLTMVLAPRHPERFSAIAALLQNSGIPWIKRSGLGSTLAGTIQPLSPGQIVLLDTIGELASVYSLAAVAFVGGSLVPAGGHNPLEPAQFGVPIVMGPHYANFRAITDDLGAHDALRIAAKEDLAAALIDLLRDQPAANAMGERARQVFERQSGATQRCVDALNELLPGPVLKLGNISVVDPAIAKNVRRLYEQASDVEAVLAYLRKAGLRQLESITILHSVLGFPLAEGKRAIRESATWRDYREAQDAEINSLLEELNGVERSDRPQQG